MGHDVRGQAPRLILLEGRGDPEGSPLLRPNWLDYRLTIKPNPAMVFVGESRRGCVKVVAEQGWYKVVRTYRAYVVDFGFYELARFEVGRNEPCEVAQRAALATMRKYARRADGKAASR